MTGTARISAWLVAGTAAVLTATQLSAQSTVDLIDAVRAGDAPATRTLLSDGADVDARQGDGATALHWAAHRDDLEAAALLIGAGADANAVNELGATALWLAAVNGSPEMVGLLLDAGADPNVALEMGETPLMSASRSGNVDAVELLLDAGAEVDAAERERGQTALMWAAAQRHPEVAELLIERGASLHARSSVWYQLENTAGNTNPTGNFDMAHGGSTPLLFAARAGDVETAKALIDAGADVDDIAAAGTSALVIASHSGHSELGIHLLKRGADPNGAGAGYTALHAAVLRGLPDLVQALLDHGADPNALVQHGTPGRRFSADFSIRAQLIGVNAMWLAAQYGEPEIFGILVNGGGVPLTSPESGKTVLHAAMGLPGGSSSESRRYRVANRPPDPEGEERATLELARTIVGLGVDIDAIDNRGNTALHHAVIKNFPSVVEFLIAGGAEIDLANDRDQTPLILAETAQTFPGTNGLRGTRPEVAEVLRRLGASD